MCEKITFSRLIFATTKNDPDSFESNIARTLQRKEEK